jgi:5-methylcytosine-specific restriction endonuclease McrA
MSKPCKHCGSRQHTSFRCFKKPRKPIKVSSLRPLKRTPLKKIGRITKKWFEVRKDWFAINEGPYFCFIGGEPLALREVQLDHVKSRSRHPELRFDLDNLRPICADHNRAKGSLSLDEYLKRVNGPKAI